MKKEALLSFSYYNRIAILCIFLECILTLLWFGASLVSASLPSFLFASMFFATMCSVYGLVLI